MNTPTAAILFALVSASPNGVLLSTLTTQFGSARLATAFRSNLETGELDTFVVITR